mmetsp:Transcript_32421/g.76950  ORF Transcript_32421/g.76950 Transcript_32421/m.76950 type:complete len:241 (+) Transcript_32421:734-1456(+)
MHDMGCGERSSGHAADCARQRGLRHRVGQSGGVCQRISRPLRPGLRPQGQGPLHHHIREPRARHAPHAPRLEQAGPEIPGDDPHGLPLCADPRHQVPYVSRRGAQAAHRTCQCARMGAALLLPHMHGRGRHSGPHLGPLLDAAQRGFGDSNAAGPDPGILRPAGDHAAAVVPEPDRLGWHLLRQQDADPASLRSSAFPPRRLLLPPPARVASAWRACRQNPLPSVQCPVPVSVSVHPLGV